KRSLPSSLWHAEESDDTPAAGSPAQPLYLLILLRVENSLRIRAQLPIFLRRGLSITQVSAQPRPAKPSKGCPLGKLERRTRRRCYEAEGHEAVGGSLLARLRCRSGMQPNRLPGRTASPQGCPILHALPEHSAHRRPAQGRDRSDAAPLELAEAGAAPGGRPPAHGSGEGCGQGGADSAAR